MVDSRGEERDERLEVAGAGEEGTGTVLQDTDFGRGGHLASTVEQAVDWNARVRVDHENELSDATEGEAAVSASSLPPSEQVRTHRLPLAHTLPSNSSSATASVA